VRSENEPNVIHFPLEDSDIPSIQLAPMEGVLDWVLRELLSEVGGFDRMVTEFVRVTDRLQPDHVFYKYSPELANGGRTKAGTPVFIQLLGGQPGPLAENAHRVGELGAPGVDLNFGCPAKTVNRHDGGATLLKAPDRLFHILKAVTAATPVTVTAKVRLGFDHKDFIREIAQAVEEGGARHIVVHARTKTEMYTKPAHWEYIARMKEGRSIPFLANGEIWSVDDYHKCAAASGVSRVALGRGVVRRPTLAQEIRAARSGIAGHEVTGFERTEFLSRFFHETLAFRGPDYALARIKQILRYWSLEDAEALLWFNQVKLMRSAREVQSYLLEFVWPQSRFTQPLIAPTAFEPRIS
jgi:tRNA-dihydrouridine synthase C